MSLELKINDGIKKSMLAKDKLRLETLRSIKSGILLAKTAENAVEITEDFEIKMLQKMAKQRKESASIYIQQNRNELAEKELAEAAIIEEYLPQQLSEEEITVAIKKIVANSGATSAKDMGKVMSAATRQLAGKADGRLISDIVKKILA